MAKNAVVFFGVSGVGKTTIAQAISARHSGARYISGSNILLAALGGIPREQLEQISYSNKLSLVVPALQTALQEHSSADFILLDSHLVAFARRGSGMVCESLWSDLYAPYIARAYMIVAPPRDIFSRRVQDVNLRHRDINLPNIISDQVEHLRVFAQTFDVSFRPSIVNNRAGRLESVIAGVDRQILEAFGVG